MKVFNFCLLFFIITIINGDVFESTYSINHQYPASLKNSFENFQNDKDIQNTLWSFYAENLNSKQVVIDFSSNKSLIPASTLKVLTTATAYEILGKSYRFSTILKHSGTIDENGVLQGDLIISGDGDPSIGSSYFGNWVNANSIFQAFYNSINKLGIKEINGNIIGDASHWGYMLQPTGYLWEDIGNHFGAGTSSLNYKENKLKLTFKSGNKIGDKAELISSEPHPIGIEWINNVTTAASNTGDNVYIFGAPFQKFRIINGTMPAARSSFDVFASDPDPAHRFASDFKTFLISKNIKISGNEKSNYLQTETKTQNIYTHRSPELDLIARFVNQRSNNLSAESLLRAIGTKFGNSNYQESADAILNYWKNKNINIDGIVLKDGSGLSRTNLLSTKFLVDVLKYIYYSDYYDSYKNSLALAGKTGTLQNAFKASSAENNYIGKTGSMGGIRSYAGFINNKSGETICFAFIVNGHTLKTAEIRKKMETLIISLSDSE